MLIASVEEFAGEFAEAVVHPVPSKRSPVRSKASKLPAGISTHSEPADWYNPFHLSYSVRNTQRNPPLSIIPWSFWSTLGGAATVVSICSQSRDMKLPFTIQRASPVVCDSTKE
jgi:hypothetical protein